MDATNGYKVTEHVLVTSVSRKVPLLKRLRQSCARIDPGLRIIGADADETCIGRYFVDDFWKMPRTEVLSVNEVLVVCREKDRGHHPHPRRGAWVLGRSP